MAATPPPEEGERQTTGKGYSVLYVHYVFSTVPFVYSYAGILVFKDKWLCRIILREKSMEIRGQRLKAGAYLFGCRGRIYARAVIGTPIFVDTIQTWQGLRCKHRVQGNKLPYKKTWALPITELKLYPRSHPYKKQNGAIGIVKYKPP